MCGSGCGRGLYRTCLRCAYALRITRGGGKPKVADCHRTSRADMLRLPDVLQRPVSLIFRSRAIVLIAILGVLLIRAMPPTFAQPSPTDVSTVTCTPDHQHRSYFDHEGNSLAVPLRLMFLVVPPPPALHGLNFTDSVPLTRETEPQYNRPPPTI